MPASSRIATRSLLKLLDRTDNMQDVVRIVAARRDFAEKYLKKTRREFPPLLERCGNTYVLQVFREAAALERPDAAGDMRRLRPSPQETLMVRRTVVAFALWVAAAGARLRPGPAGRRTRSGRDGARAPRAHHGHDEGSGRPGAAGGHRHARRPQRQGRLPRGRRPTRHREERADDHRHALPHRLDEQGGDQRRGHDARRGGPHAPRRSGLALHPVVREDDGRRAAAGRARRRR